jgi:hypothetical protein
VNKVNRNALNYISVSKLLIINSFDEIKLNLIIFYIVLVSDEG